MTQPNQAAK